MAGWIARHRADLERWSSFGSIPRRIVETVPSTPTELAVTMGLEFAVVIAVSALAARDVRKGLPLYVYSALLGVFLLHAGTHVLQAVIFGAYTPGVVTATMVIPPVCILSYRTLLRRGLLSLKKAVTTAVVGVVVFLPLFAAVVHLARRLGEL